MSARSERIPVHLNKIASFMSGEGIEFRKYSRGRERQGQGQGLNLGVFGRVRPSHYQTVSKDQSELRSTFTYLRKNSADSMARKGKDMSLNTSLNGVVYPIVNQWP